MCTRICTCARCTSHTAHASRVTGHSLRIAHAPAYRCGAAPRVFGSCRRPRLYPRTTYAAVKRVAPPVPALSIPHSIHKSCAAPSPDPFGTPLQGARKHRAQSEKEPPWRRRPRGDRSGHCTPGLHRLHIRLHEVSKGLRRRGVAPSAFLPVVGGGGTVALGGGGG